MNVSLGKKLYLTRDTYQYIIRKDTGNVDKEGKTIYNNLSYHGSLDRVAEALYRLKINESTAQTIKELRDDHNKIIAEIREVFSLEGLLK
ncbi:hypothetical protein [Oceanobacillus sp. FSL H7-0719]|uniref:hypothetical protein n=1 Tax=Oceanobacillus sp. FSL H7-0719 TaxID=2954507 RepID=UPI003252BC1F